MQCVYVLNGPNLNLLGVREPEIYGRASLADIEALCQNLAQQFGWELRFLQSNYEGALVEWVHEARAAGAAVIMNPAGCSFVDFGNAIYRSAFEQYTRARCRPSAFDFVQKSAWSDMRFWCARL